MRTRRVEKKRVMKFPDCVQGVGGNLYDGTEAGCIEAFMRLVPLIAEQPFTEPPRTLHHYSNAGYLLLGALVANVSGEPYAGFVAETCSRNSMDAARSVRYILFRSHQRAECRADRGKYR